MTEQSSTTAQITKAVASMRQQSSQMAQAVNEQTRATREINTSFESISKQVALIAHANAGHSQGVPAILESLAEIREVTEHTIQGIEQSKRSAGHLRQRADSLSQIGMRLGDGRKASRGRPRKT